MDIPAIALGQDEQVVLLDDDLVVFSSEDRELFRLLIELLAES